MKFERENKKPIELITEKQLRRQLGYKDRFDTTFAILSADDHSYIQMLGGGIGCCLEWFDRATMRCKRAYGDTVLACWKDQTRLGANPMRPEDFLMIEVVTEAFVAFLNGAPFPPELHWRDITDELRAAGVRFEFD